MDLPGILIIAVGLGAAVAGVALGLLASRQGGVGRSAAIEAEVALQIAEAEAKNAEILLEARDEAARLKSRATTDARQQREDIKAEQGRLRGKEEALERKAQTIEAQERKLADRQREVQGRVGAIEELRGRELAELERVSSLTHAEAKDQILTRIDAEMREEASRRARQTIETVRLNADEEARHIVTLAVERLDPERRVESSAKSIPVPEEMKGRIIGREGRNIRAFEAVTGMTLAVDDAPGVVTITGFDPIKREIARVALIELLRDGRIHPQRIEEEVARATIAVERDMLQAGKEAAEAAGVPDLHPEILKVFGRMKYRTSYGQNQLMHSVEVSRIARILAHELGADPEVAARGALLHDIGKVMGHEVEGPHHVIGADLVRHHGELAAVADAIVEHHDSDPELVSMEAVIVQTADAISGARPGARHESAEQYVKRIEALESVANSYPGVEKCFAIQAGREVRIIVKPDQVDDEASIRLARDVAKQIETSVVYPGEVKVVVVRETKATEVAR